MGDEENRATGAGDVLHFAEAPFLKFNVTYREDFIDNQDLRTEMSSDSKTEADGHPGGVTLYRRIDKSFHSRKLNDLIKTFGHLLSRHPQDSAVEEDVLTPCQFLMKAGPHLK